MSRHSIIARNVLTSAFLLPALLAGARAPAAAAHASPNLPQPMYAPAPSYSDSARRARIQGTVLVRAEIDAAGSVTAAKVVKGLPLGLSDRALESVRSWRFEPLADRMTPTREVDLGIVFALPEYVGAVVDPLTRLAWTLHDNGRKIGLEEATDFCHNVRSTISARWRVPTVVELERLADRRRVERDDCTARQAREPATCFVRLGIDLTGPVIVSTSTNTGNPTTTWFLDFREGSRQERLSNHAGVHQRALCVGEVE